MGAFSTTGGSHRHLQWWCPGCEDCHVVPIEGPKAWGWSGGTEAPTLTPSVRVRYHDGAVCHLFVREGNLVFLGDCTHALAGQTIKARPRPEADG